MRSFTVSSWVAVSIRLQCVRPSLVGSLPARSGRGR